MPAGYVFLLIIISYICTVSNTLMVTVTQDKYAIIMVITSNNKGTYDESCHYQHFKVNVLMYEKWDTILAKSQVSFAITLCLSPYV